MNKQGRVLVVDDLENWREELAETLQRDGFYVDTASTASEALKSLSETLYHLLVLDIRMDEADPNDTDGLDLLRELDKQGLSEALQIIMLSAHDTKEQVRTAFKEHGVADFLSKDKFNNREFLQDVRQIFAQKIKSNLALDIHYQQIKRAEDAIANLEINSRRLKKEPAMLKQIAIELEDLLQRLFSQAESILVRPIGSGQSTTGVLWVQPFYLTGGGRPVIVKFGDFRKDSIGPVPSHGR